VTYNNLQVDPSQQTRSPEICRDVQHNLNVALKWAEVGAYVFVAGPDKKPRVKWRGQSTTNLDTIREWFVQWPDSLPAIDLAKSGHVVLDGDRHGGPDGVAAAEQLFAEHKLSASAIPTVITPQDGRHYWFRQPTDREPLGNSDKPIRDKAINVRGAGGYVIAPGARLPNGKQYKRDKNTPSALESVRHAAVPVLPTSIETLLRPNGHDKASTTNGHDPREEAYARSALDNIARELDRAAPGARNIELNNAALKMGHMVASGWIGRATVEGRLFDAAAACGLVKDDGAHSVRSTIKSGLDAGEKEPNAPLGDNHATSRKTFAPGAEELRTPQAKILSSAEFIKSFIPPDYLIEGLLQRQFFYSLTGKTGAGKTAIALLFAAFIALGRIIDGREFCKGRVLYLAGENPVDVQMRWIAMSQQLDFDYDTIDVHFSPGVFQISEMERHISEEVGRLGGVSLVIIDTTAAYFEGDDENNNVQAGAYARMQRKLVNLPGGPTVLALCHPVKNATDDNLLPRGGGAYLNEVDGNLTAQGDGVVVHLHWQGKYRGHDFAPVSFQLKSVTHELLKDSKGRQLTTVMAAPLSDVGEKAIKDAAGQHQDELLEILDGKGRGASLEELARLLGWLSSNGKPNKGLVHRTAQTLKNQKLVKNARKGGLELTPAGKAELRGKTDD
jgi:hypothetical protein